MKNNSTMEPANNSKGKAGSNTTVECKKLSNKVVEPTTIILQINKYIFKQQKM